MSPRRVALAFGIANLFTAALVAFGVFVALPMRWWPIDVAACALAAIQAAAGAGLVRDTRWAKRVARAAAATALALGLFAVSVLAVTASWLGGIYGAVGRGGAIVLALSAALAFPYVVALPVGQLLWLRPRSGDRA